MVKAYWKQAAVGIATLLLLVSGLGYYLLVDGRLPDSSDFQINLDEIRQLASTALPDDRPHTIEVEVLARQEVPRLATQAGLDFEPVTMARSVFRLRSDWGDTMIDVGMNRRIADEFSPGHEFDDEAFVRVERAVIEARRITVTHEHPDHIGLLGPLSTMTELANRLHLSKNQLDSIASYTTDKQPPVEFEQVTPAPAEALSIAAPGVVMIPAPGHTPGNVLFYVLMRDGREILFLGDIVWNMSNIRDGLGRPRLVQDYIMPVPEDRTAVFHQLAAIIALQIANPDLILIPSHDEENILVLLRQNWFQTPFQWN